MAQCYLCKAKITELNKSKEHIIPNVLGGTITSEKLLCRKCNNQTAVLEQKLADQFILFLSALGIKRQRGQFPETKIKTENNDTIYLCEGLKVKEKIKYTEISSHQKLYTVPDMATARRVLEKEKERYSEIDIEKILSEVKVGEHYLDDKIKFSCNIDNICCAALCKIMINYALHKNYSVGNIKPLAGFINGEKDFMDDSEGRCVRSICPIKIYSGDSPIIAPNAIICGVGVFGSYKRGKLYGFIQLFNFSKYCVVLDDEYVGENVEDGIIFFNEDAEISPNFSLKVFEENVDKHLDKEQLRKELKDCVIKILQKQEDEELERICKNTVREIQEKYPEENYPYITEEIVGDLSSTLAERVVKFMIHMGAIKHE